MNDSEKIVVVSGAGAAGISAAITTARAGCPAFLIEKSSGLGGTVTNSLIHTLGGVFDSSGEFINNGIVVELAERLFKADSYTKKRKIGRIWVLQCSPEIYEKVIEDWIIEESNIRLLRNSIITSVKLNTGNPMAVSSITVKSGDETYGVSVMSLIDTTGSGETVKLINPNLIIDNEPRASDGLIFIMRGVEPRALNFPNNIQQVQHIREAVREGRLPDIYTDMWIDQGVYEGEAYLKMTIGRDSFNIDIKNLINELILFLQTLPAFSKAYLYKTGCRGVRDSGEVAGEYRLTQEDALNARKFDDAACRCSWPIEYWDTEKGVSIKYLQDNDYYEIPLRSLKARGLKNVWVAGKCFSGDSKVRASARVAGCCWPMGEAAAKAAIKVPAKNIFSC